MTGRTLAVKPRLGWSAWLLGLAPLLLLGLLLATGGGLAHLAGPPVEQVAIQRITLPRPGLIQMEVVNDGPQPVTIAQVMVDEAYWSFQAEPAPTIPRLGRVLVTIPYPWVAEEAHEVVLVTELGSTFAGEIPVAVMTPRPSLDLFARFGLIGFYVGVIPVLLGTLWYPFLRRLGRRAMDFILALTVGLLIFLAVGTWMDAMEFARELPTFWQGPPLVIFVAVITLGALLAVGNSGRGQRTPLQLAYLIALGIGLHNLGEGLAIGASFAAGEAALGTFLVLGFTTHNITEGVGIAAPILGKNPGLGHFALLVLLAGTPAILGTWIGGFAFNPVLATFFLAVGVGAILQVVWDVGKLLVRSAPAGRPPVNWVTLGGVATGLAIMYFTAFLVKF